MFAAPPRRCAGPRAVRGGTLLGFAIGLVVGMAIAVFVATLVTRSPVPFVNKTGRASDRLVEPPRPDAELPDPNKPLYAKNRPAAPTDVSPPPPREEGLSILERLFGRTPSAPEPEPPRPATEQAAVKGDAKPADARGGGEARPAPDARGADAAERVAYLLQAGAFRSQEDADGMRGKLALLGFEAKVLAAEVNGQTLFRVRVGPYAQIDDMNKARARLAENGIEASVVRQR